LTFLFACLWKIGLALKPPTSKILGGCSLSYFLKPDACQHVTASAEVVFGFRQKRTSLDRLSAVVSQVRLFIYLL